MKTAFSLLEIIIVILIVGIISAVGIQKLFFSLDDTKYLEVKTQVHLIQNAIVQKQNKQLLLGESNSINVLDDAVTNTASQRLFTHVLSQPLISTSSYEKAIAKWIKLNANTYEVYINSNESLVFDFDNEKGTFECDYDQTSCQEIYQ